MTWRKRWKRRKLIKSMMGKTLHVFPSIWPEPNEWVQLVAKTYVSKDLLRSGEPETIATLVADSVSRAAYNATKREMQKYA